MGDFIEAKDPRGVKIYCLKSQWEQHIVTKPTGHPEMDDNVAAVIETLSTPDNIYESHDSDPPMGYREIYSKETKSATYHSYAPYTKVVVSVVGGSGEIITTYPSRNPVAGVKGEAIYIANNES